MERKLKKSLIRKKKKEKVVLTKTKQRIGNGFEGLKFKAWGFKIYIKFFENSAKVFVMSSEHEITSGQILPMFWNKFIVNAFLKTIINTVLIG